jgi:hypothetical protein
MKYINKKFTYVFLLFQFLIVNANSQEVVQGFKQVFDISPDDKGNAIVEVSYKLNAAYWDMFKRNIGNNTSLLKREMEKALPKYFLSDFKYSEEPMERSYKVKFKALGIASLTKKGIWEAKLDTKNPDVTKLSDREFLINTDLMSNGMLINQIQKIHLPPQAKNAKIEKDSFGKAVLTYSTGFGVLPRILTYTGIALILAGGFLFYKNNRPATNKLRVAKNDAAAA